MRTALLALLLSCESPADKAEDSAVSEDLVSDGLEGATLDSAGLWVRRTLFFVEDGTSVTQHFFMFGNSPNLCLSFHTEWPEDPEATGDAAADCLATKAYYQEMSEFNALLGAPGDFYLELELWGTDSHGSAPTSGSFTPLDGPDADVVEVAAYGALIRRDVYSEAAAAIDCDRLDTGGDPYADLPSFDNSIAAYDLESGVFTLDVDEDDDEIWYAMDRLELTPQDDDVEAGTLDGTGMLTPCDYTEIVEAPAYYGE